jgi:uncharacterized membrane protein YraQ (UPF0718 family)
VLGAAVVVPAFLILRILFAWAVAILLGIVMFEIFPTAPAWLNLLPATIVWVVATPLMERRTLRKRQEKNN